MLRTLRAPLALLAVALFTALAVPVAARADDRAFAQTAIDRLEALGRYERAIGRAMSSLQRKGPKAIPATRRAVRAGIREAGRTSAAIRGLATEGEEAATAKAKVLELLAAEQRAYRTLDRGLAALKDGKTSTARTLIRRASRSLDSITRAAFEVGKTLGRLSVS